MNETSRSGAELIAEERRRQMEEEGWTAENDAGYTSGQLVDAAICYARAADLMVALPGQHSPEEVKQLITSNGLQGLCKWPWSRDWLKVPEYPVRSLVKAGALLAAEIDRIKRTLGKEVETPGQRMEEALKLLDEAADFFAEKEVAPPGLWFRRLFVVTGEHMILTEEGWEPGIPLKDMTVDERCEVLDEVNAPEWRAAQIEEDRVSWGPSGGPQTEERSCRVCGCTERDCSQCVEKTGSPCHWVEGDLCSACVGKEQKD